MSLGHNAPPSAADDLAAEATTLAATDLPFAIEDDAIAKAVADFGKRATAFLKRAEAARKAEKELWLEGGRRVDTTFREIVTPVSKLLAEAKQMVGDYQAQKMAAERARREAEAARLQAEADRVATAALRGQGDVAAAVESERAAQIATAAVQAAPAELGRVTDNAGAVVAQARSRWEYEITDPAALPREYLIPADVKIAAVVRALKGETNIPGVRVFERLSTVF